jgi:hypothetical protein
VFFQQKFATFVNEENLKHLTSNSICLSQWVVNIRGFFSFLCCDTQKIVFFPPKNSKIGQIYTTTTKGFQQIVRKNTGCNHPVRKVT